METAWHSLGRTRVTDRIFLSAPSLGAAELQRISDAIAADEIAMGAATREFESRLAAQAGTSGAAAVASGTAALHLALDVLGVGPGDTVFCSSLTFIASASPIRFLGAEPVFIDCGPESWNMSPAALERALGEAKAKNALPKAVVVVNLYGQCADFAAIMPLCAHYNIPVVEDAAESLGATLNDRPSGGLGDIGIYSFNGNKILTTGGGGAVLSNDEEQLALIRNLSSQAREPVLHYEHERLGYNYRISNIAAAIGNGQLDQLSDRLAQRDAVFRRYREALGTINGAGFMPDHGKGRHSRWLSVMTIDPAAGLPAPAAICEALEARNIEARPVWKPMHRQPVFAGCTWYSHEDTRSISDEIFATALCLPSGPDITPDIQDQVIAALTDILQG